MSRKVQNGVAIGKGVAVELDTVRFNANPVGDAGVVRRRGRDGVEIEGVAGNDHVVGDIGTELITPEAEAVGPLTVKRVPTDCGVLEP